ncbi:6957_t:CDS:2 [Ambispora gerdemannii]|uniref:6957_t:CDS:1 n=1 Tax=Ambispora gerdemannii TaxID=144530 RepID=A0A9N9BX51_9GLOM|nr:6957_t:CDS:2 [Ambispora gerdemannii]
MNPNYNNSFSSQSIVVQPRVTIEKNGKLTTVTSQSLPLRSSRLQLFPPQPSQSQHYPQSSNASESLFSHNAASSSTNFDSQLQFTQSSNVSGTLFSHNTPSSSTNFKTVLNTNQEISGIINQKSYDFIIDAYNNNNINYKPILFNILASMKTLMPNFFVSLSLNVSRNKASGQETEFILSSRPAPSIKAGTKLRHNVTLEPNQMVHRSLFNSLKINHLNHGFSLLSDMTNGQKIPLKDITPFREAIESNNKYYTTYGYFFTKIDYSEISRKL